jgi:hypothetical protein
MKRRELALVAMIGMSACAAGPMAKRTSMAMPEMAGAAAPGPSTIAADPSAAPQVDEAIVVEGTLSIEVVDVGAAAGALRAEVEGGGGHIVDEKLDGGAAAYRGEVQLRVAPDKVAAILTWLGGQGTILDKHLSATDVSHTLFDRDLAIANKRAALTRLEAILERGGATMADVLAIENEMTRLRGEVEALEGEQRYLRDRVAQATITVTLVRRDGEVEVHVTEAKLYPGARFAMLTLLDPGQRPRTRLGVGVVAHSVLRTMSFEVDLFTSEREAPGADAHRAVIATLGGAGYSDFLGRGQRRFGNPYLGFRAGYAYLDRSLFAIQGEAGVELVKGRHGVIDLGVRATGLIGKKADVALVTGLGAAVAF